MKPLVTVITPTTGSHQLYNVLKSVSTQTYSNIEHIVVADGPQYSKATQGMLEGSQALLIQLPYNTGHSQYNGHRIYGAMSYIANGDYLCFLDQDNWYEDNHIESLIDVIQQGNDWAYSLRKIVSQEGTYICNDDCESLGKWQTYHGVNHIDTNCYCIKTSTAIKLSQVWHGGWGQDRVFLSAIAQHFPRFHCTSEYTVNYRVDGNPGSVNADFFYNGNKVMNQKYNGVFPWRKEI